MKRNPDASFYALHVSVQPGGARESVMFLLNNLPDVKEQVDNAVRFSPYLMLWYGRAITLTTLHNGEAVDQIDLMPCITYQIDGYPTIGFDEKSEPVGMTREQIRADKALTDALWQQGTDQQKENAPAIRYAINWEQISPPPLEGNLLQPGERTMTDEMVLGYGGNDLEEGLFFGEGDEDEDTMDWEEEWMDAEEAGEE